MSSLVKAVVVDAEKEVNLPPLPRRNNSNAHVSHDDVSKDWDLNSDVEELHVERQAYAAEYDCDLMLFADGSVADSDVFEDIDLEMQTYAEQERALSVVENNRDPINQDGFDASDSVSDVFDDLPTYTEQKEGASTKANRDSDANDSVSDVFANLEVHTEQEEGTRALVDKGPISKDVAGASVSNSADIFDDVEAAQEEDMSLSVGSYPITDGVDARDGISVMIGKVGAEMQTYTTQEEDLSTIAKIDSFDEDGVDSSVANFDNDIAQKVDASVVFEKDPIREKDCYHTHVDVGMKTAAARPTKELVSWGDFSKEPLASMQPHGELAFLQESPELATHSTSRSNRWSDVSSVHSLCLSMSDGDDDDHQEFTLDETWDFNDNADDSIDVVNDPFLAASTLSSNDTSPLLGNSGTGSFKKQTASDETVNSNASSDEVDNDSDASLGDPFQTPSTSPMNDDAPLLGQVLDTYKLEKITGEKRRRSKSAPPRTDGNSGTERFKKRMASDETVNSNASSDKGDDDSDVSLSDPFQTSTTTPVNEIDDAAVSKGGAVLSESEERTEEKDTDKGDDDSDVSLSDPFQTSTTTLVNEIEDVAVSKGGAVLSKSEERTEEKDKGSESNYRAKSEVKADEDNDDQKWVTVSNIYDEETFVQSYATEESAAVSSLEKKEQAEISKLSADELIKLFIQTSVSTNIGKSQSVTPLRMESPVNCIRSSAPSVTSSASASLVDEAIHEERPKFQGRSPRQKRLENSNEILDREVLLVKEKVDRMNARLAKNNAP